MGKQVFQNITFKDYICYTEIVSAAEIEIADGNNLERLHIIYSN